METNITSSSPSNTPAETCSKRLYAISKRFSCNKEMTSVPQEEAIQKGLRSHPQLGIAILRLLNREIDVNNPEHREAINKLLNKGKVFPADLKAQLGIDNMNLEDYTFWADSKKRETEEAKEVDSINWKSLLGLSS